MRTQLSKAEGGLDAPQQGDHVDVLDATAAKEKQKLSCLETPSPHIRSERNPPHVASGS